MIKKFDNPVYMTTEEIEEKYYPHRVLLVNCDERDYCVTGGYVVAMETIPDDDYPELFDLQSELTLGGKHGKVYMVLTRMPLEGEWLCVEFAKPDRVTA